MKTLTLILLVGLGGMAKAEDVLISSGPCVNMSPIRKLKIEWFSEREEKNNKQHKSEFIEFGFREDGVMVWRVKEKK